MQTIHPKAFFAILVCCGLLLIGYLQHDPDKGAINIQGRWSTKQHAFPLKTPLQHAGSVLQRRNGKWNISSAETCTTNQNFTLAYLRKPPKTPIFVYQPHIDKHVSGTIVSKGHYEGPWIEKILRLLDKFPDAVFLDIGSHVGAYSVTVAALGHKVVAIDMFSENIMRLCASMTAANLTNRLTIIHNAVSDKHQTVNFGMYRGDVGGTFTIYEGIHKDRQSVQSIRLDDLINIFNIKQVIIKMDVEKSEDKVLMGAYNFFKEVQVEAVLMEFIKHKRSSSGKFIVDFLLAVGLEPDVPNNLKKDFSKWDVNNILFKRQ